MAKFCLRGGFPAGTKVGIYERVGDNFSAALDKVKSAKVSADSVLEVDGLPEGPYFVAALVEDAVTGEKVQRVRAVTAKPPELVAAVPRAQPVKIRADGTPKPTPIADSELSPSLRSQPEDPEIITGVQTKRTRGHVPPSDPLAIEHDPDSAGRQDGISALGERGAPKHLASDTFAGQAIEATPAGGRLQQDEVPDGTPQASDTELGDAALIVDVEEAPLGDHDPNRASGDSAIGPAGTVSPANLGDKSTTRKRRDAEARSAAAQKAARTRKRAAAKRSNAAKKAAATRAAKREQEARASKPAPNKGERSTSRATSKKDAQGQATAKSRGRS